MQAQYVFHSDAGHGWLQVPVADIDELGIGQYISQFSYRRRDTVYLEEDCDMGLFMQAYSAKVGTAAAIVDGRHVDRSFIRDCPSYW